MKAYVQHVAAPENGSAHLAMDEATGNTERADPESVSGVMFALVKVP